MIEEIPDDEQAMSEAGEISHRQRVANENMAAQVSQLAQDWLDKNAGSADAVTLAEERKKLALEARSADIKLLARPSTTQHTIRPTRSLLDKIKDLLG